MGMGMEMEMEMGMGRVREGWSRKEGDGEDRGGLRER